MEFKNVCIKNEDILLFSRLYTEFDCAPLIETHELASLAKGIMRIKWRQSRTSWIISSAL